MNEEIKSRLLESVGNFSKKRVLVLGDSIVDEFIYGKPFGMSLDSLGTKKILHEKTDFFSGGAGNVVKNLLALGTEVCFITVLGRDEFANHYHNWKHPKLKLCAFVEEGRKTVVKSRYSDGKNRHLEVERWDYGDIKEDTEDKVIEAVKEELTNSDVVIFQDQGHGFFSKSLIGRLRELVGGKGHKVLVNSQTYIREANHADYKGFDMIFINVDEAKALDSNFKTDGDGGVLRDMLDSKICLTLGDGGVVLFDRDKRYHSKSIPVEAIDTCGAGDSFLAAFSSTDFKSNPEFSLKLASIWAGLSTLKNGTETPSIQEMKDYIDSMP
jgi:rfaE bifunctional protein kinase chain/domain